MSAAVLSWLDAALTFHVLRFDAVETESATFASELTRFAVEQGSDVSDHLRELPTSISIGAYVTQKPINGSSLTKTGFQELVLTASLLQFPAYTPRFLPTPGGVTQAVTGLLSGPPQTQESVTVLQALSEIDRPSKVLQVLSKLKSDAQLIEFNSASYSVVNCVLTEITPSRAVGDGGAYRIALTLETVRVASTKRTETIYPADLRAKKASKKGTKAGETQSVPEENTSFLRSAIGKNLFK